MISGVTEDSSRNKFDSNKMTVLNLPPKSIKERTY